MNVIPLPASYVKGDGTLKLDKFALSPENYLRDLTKLNAKIHLLNEQTDGADKNEKYTLEINADGISVFAASSRGIFYAYATLCQLLYEYDFSLPYCKISDCPRFPYRGFMLDVGRYYMPVEDIKKLVRLCALHKINKFRLHLTEDQGWRIEIEKYPLLTQKGSVRNGTNFSHKKHGGYYTQKELKELVGYCKKFFIELIPEIDMPGHSRAAIACYPYLSCFDRKLPVATHWGVKHDILCAGKESTYKFAEDVWDEACEIFDGEFVHIGGDEAPETRWKICPCCQKKMRDEGLENEKELQSYFLNRLAKHLRSKGKKVMMWNEFQPTFKTDKSLIRQFWSSPAKEQTAIREELRTGLKYVNSHAKACYLDLPEKTVSLKKSYLFNPFIEGAEEGLLGVEACLWSEYVPDYDKAQKLTLPRLCALSEVMWTDIADEKKDYDRFVKRLDAHTAYLEQYGYKVANYSDSLFNKSRVFFSWLWFNRRPLHWEGLRNAIDNAYVKRKYKKLSSKNRTSDTDGDA